MPWMQTVDVSSPMIKAARMADWRRMKELIAEGANINALDNGTTPLIEACRQSPPAYDGPGKEIPESERVMYPWKRAFIQTLLDNGADVNVRGENGETALHKACWYGHNDVVMAFLEKGADVNARSEKGQTPLMWAARSASSNVVQALLDKGADVTPKDDLNGYTALDWANRRGEDNKLPNKEEVLAILKPVFERQNQLKREKEVEKKRREEKERQEWVRKAEEWARKVEEDRIKIKRIRSEREAAKVCIMCGKPFGFFDKLRGIKQHATCSTFSE